MIASLKGRIIDVKPDHLVIENGGVGIMVYAPNPTLNKAHLGEMLFLHTHLVVRQDALILFGFEESEWRSIFLLLLGVNGIGPRSALSILSVLPPETIRSAVFHDQSDVFCRVPGIGKKTAQKIVLLLQDKIRPEAGMAVISKLSELDEEVLGALTGLGYSIVEAQAALQSIPGNASEDVAERIRLALQYFSSP